MHNNIARLARRLCTAVSPNVLVVMALFVLAHAAADACPVYHEETYVIHHEAEGHYEVIYYEIAYVAFDENGNDYWWTEYVEETIWVEDSPAYDEWVVEIWY